MPTFYEGKPIATVEQSLREPDYAAAYYAAQSTVSLLRRKEVLSGICLTVAVVGGSLIPLFYRTPGLLGGLIAVCALGLGSALLFFFVQPHDIRSWAGEIYRSNALLALPQTITVYRDSIVAKSEKETFQEYWTDFARCVETRDAFVLVGGRERWILTVQKEGLEKSERETLSAHFQDAFARRYQKFGR
ncbi:MAG: hypothetical protein GX424_05470 [Clostridiales bacterium]|nr:hypothetical protein [Clostridiales bacterium]